MERLAPLVPDFDDDPNEYMNQCIGLTVNPDPRRYNSVDPCEQYRSLIQTLLSNRAMRNTFYEFVFWPELTKNGNVHLHGHYRIKDKVKYYKWFLPLVKRIAPSGYYIETRVDIGWLEYETKSVEDAMSLFEEEGLPVPYDQDTLIYYGNQKTKYHICLARDIGSKRRKITDYF